MKESYVEGLANHNGPESCADEREVEGEALTGVRAGRVLSRESPFLRGADAVKVGGRPHPQRRSGKTLGNPARSKTPGMRGNILHGNREVPRLSAGKPGSRHERTVTRPADRIGKSKDVRR